MARAAVNLKVGALVLVTVGFYTLIANTIPQVESEVPSELSFTGEVTSEQLVEAGEALYMGAGQCMTCHGTGTRAPNLLTDDRGSGLIGARCSARVNGKDCKTYLHEAMVKPTAFVVEGFQPIMPDMSRTMTANQIWALVAYLESLGGTVSVSSADLAQEGAAPAGGAAPGATGATASLEPLEIMRANMCLTCHKLGAEGGPIGPAFDGMGSRLTADGIRRGILQPNADTAAGYAATAGTMPQTFGAQLTAAQLEALVTFIGGKK